MARCAAGGLESLLLDAPRSNDARDLCGALVGAIVKPAVGAADALQHDTIRNAVLDDAGLFPAPAPAPGSAPGAEASAIKRKKQPKKYQVSRKMKQKDRISDDYYELLRQVA